MRLRARFFPAIFHAIGAIAIADPVCAKDQRVWTLSGFEQRKPERISLFYEAPETDDIFGGFYCKPKSGVVTVFISETSGKLEPGKRTTGVLSVGGVTTKVAGKLLPNEEAGVPSFEGTLPASDPIFAALAGGETLTVTFGSAKDTAPLKGAAEKFRKLGAACAKP